MVFCWSSLAVKERVEANLSVSNRATVVEATRFAPGGDAVSAVYLRTALVQQSRGERACVRMPQANVKMSLSGSTWSGVRRYADCTPQLARVEPERFDFWPTDGDAFHRENGEPRSRARARSGRAQAQMSI
jgi:hypothetical protein